MKDITAINFR